MGRSVTKSFPDGNRRRSMTYPFEFVEPIIFAEPRKPAPIYTFWRKPNDTFPMGSIVYFMYSGGRVKIGYSAGLVSRHTTLKTAGPFPPVVVLIVGGTPDTEKQFHGRFAADRLHGEWFSLSKGMRNFFRARLCPVGRASLKAAEAEFRAYCLAQVQS